MRAMIPTQRIPALTKIRRLPTPRLQKEVPPLRVRGDGKASALFEDATVPCSGCVDRLECLLSPPSRLTVPEMSPFQRAILDRNRNRCVECRDWRTSLTN